MAHETDRGFTLIESVVAVSLLAVAVSAAAPLVVMAGRATSVARQASIAQQAAREKLEQLRALAWTSDAGAVPVSDWTTDLSTTPPRAAGGVGLLKAPPDSLLSNVRGYCDFLDAAGRWLAGGTRAPLGTAWVRRWSVVPFDELADTLVLQVLVIPLQMSDPASSVSAARGLNGAWLVDLRTRSAR